MTQLGMVDRRVRGILGGSFLEHYDLLIDNGRRLVPWMTRVHWHP